MTGRDRRSVGELLLDADHTARDVLMDVGDLDAAAMLRTWGETVRTASELWQVLPTTATPATAATPATTRRRHAAADPMAQVAAMTAALDRSARRGPWPGPGPTDSHLQSITDSFARAVELIHRHGPAGPSSNPAVRADADAARTRIIHTLYIAAHGVRLAVTRYARPLEDAMTARGKTTATGSLAVARSVQARLDAVEQLTGAYVARTYPAALAGEHREAPRASRLVTALAEWDVHAHRAIAANPSAGHLRLVARTQELVLGHTALLLSCAAHTGAIDRFQHATRLEQPLDVARAAWATTGRSWAQLAAHAPRPDAPLLTEAAAEVRAALREITLDGSAQATREVIASRTDLTAMAGTLATVLSTSTDLAHLVRDVTTDPTVTFPARAVNAAAVAASTTANGECVRGSGTAAHVAIKDLTLNRQVRLPPVVRAREALFAERLIAANQAAAHAAAWLPNAVTADPEREQPSPGPRWAAQPAVRVPVAVPGCDR